MDGSQMNRLMGCRVAGIDPMTGIRANQCSMRVVAQPAGGRSFDGVLDADAQMQVPRVNKLSPFVQLLGLSGAAKDVPVVRGKCRTRYNGNRVCGIELGFQQCAKYLGIGTY